MGFHKGKGFTSVTDNCFVYTDDFDRPVWMFGEIKRCNTSSRRNVPDCHSGFVTRGTPFAGGHIMALELGGADKPFNIVPQYEDWQGMAGHGEWRDMERDIETTIKYKYMIVEITYESTLDRRIEIVNDYINGDYFNDHTDRMVPTFFTVWALETDKANFFNLTDTGKLNFIPSSKNLGAPYKRFEITTMPDIDRKKWINFSLRDFAIQTHKELREKNKEMEAQIEEEGTRKRRRLDTPKPFPNYANWIRQVESYTLVFEAAKKDLKLMHKWTPQEKTLFNAEGATGLSNRLMQAR